MTTFMGFCTPRDGYGYATRKLSDALALNAPEWFSVDMREKADGLQPPDGVTWEIGGDVVALCVPEWLPYIIAERRLAFTMFESTHLPFERVELLNNSAVRVLVPCEWNRKCFRENGVTTPIDLVPFGVDPNDYPLLERERDGKHPYTFLWSGTGDQRKGWDLVYRAFHAAGLGGHKDAQLIMHFRNLPKGIKGCDDKNVIVYQGLFHPPAVLRLLQRADCYVFPSRGEGWGLPPREAACTGLPVIATNFGGLAVGIDYWAMPLRVQRMAHADYGYWDCDLGQWAEPDFDHLVAQMRWCFENQKSAAYLGQRAATWLRDHQTWQQAAEQMRQIAQDAQ